MSLKFRNSFHKQRGLVCIELQLPPPRLFLRNQNLPLLGESAAAIVIDSSQRSSLFKQFERRRQALPNWASRRVSSKRRVWGFEDLMWLLRNGSMGVYIASDGFLFLPGSRKKISPRFEFPTMIKKKKISTRFGKPSLKLPLVEAVYLGILRKKHFLQNKKIKIRNWVRFKIQMGILRKMYLFFVKKKRN